MNQPQLRHWEKLVMNLWLLEKNKKSIKKRLRPLLKFIALKLWPSFSFQFHLRFPIWNRINCCHCLHFVEFFLFSFQFFLQKQQVLWSISTERLYKKSCNLCITLEPHSWCYYSAKKNVDLCFVDNISSKYKTIFNSRFG